MSFHVFKIWCAIICWEWAQAAAQDALSAQGVVQEVISRAETPHAYDWRQAAAELQLGYGYTSEANNFDTSTYDLGIGLPVSGGSMVRFGLRRAVVRGTASSNDVGRTPFKQAAQSARYEIFGGLAFGLLEGRSMTRFSPAIADVEQSLFLWLGGHYNHLSRTWVPKRRDPPPALPGQQVSNATINFELGLRYHVYLPQSFGIYFEALHERPLGGGSKLKYWTYYSGGLLWSFGAH